MISILGLTMEDAGFGDFTANLTLNVNGHEEPDYALAALRILVFVIGILGNLLVIFIILVLAEYKKAVTHW